MTKMNSNSHGKSEIGDFKTDTFTKELMTQWLLNY